MMQRSVNNEKTLCPIEPKKCPKTLLSIGLSQTGHINRKLDHSFLLLFDNLCITII